MRETYWKGHLLTTEVDTESGRRRCLDCTAYLAPMREGTRRNDKAGRDEDFSATLEVLMRLGDYSGQSLPTGQIPHCGGVAWLQLPHCAQVLVGSSEQQVSV